MPLAARSAFLAAALAILPMVAPAQTSPTDYAIEQFGAPPAIPEGPLTPELQAAVQVVFHDSIEQGGWGPEQAAGLDVIAAAGDPRVAWLIADLMRFTWQQNFHVALADAGGELLGIEFETIIRQHEILDHLIAWDVPAYPGYLETKGLIYTRFLPGLERIFVEGDVDWRLVGWGGVMIDDRPFDPPRLCSNCIPAADNPEVSSAADATWLEDDDIVFGIVVNGEARAYPRRIMEVREMVNDTLGGRDIGMPYCTLCGAAQAYFTDTLPEGVERPILRTSGLLTRSNKVMYDVVTYSVFDTFRGTALTGPLAEIGFELEQASVITSDWGSWRAAHPDTTVLVESLALGRDFDFRSGRDADGPIFPVGDVDPRLPVHEDIIGVITAEGTPIAFQRSLAMAALLQGAEIEQDGIRLVLDGGGIRAEGVDGVDLGSHQAFWFAWSQFYPETELWAG